MEARAKNIIFYSLILFLPLVKFPFFGNLFARGSQFVVWASVAVLLFALCQKNVWIKTFLVYCLGVSIYHDFFTGQIIRVQQGKLIREILIRNYSKDTMVVCITLCIAVYLINFVKKADEDYVKLAVFISSYLMLWFWIVNNFEIKIGQDFVRDAYWIAGAFLAFAIPLVLSLSGKDVLNKLAASVLFIGVLWSRSSMAILAMYSGITFYFIAKKEFEQLAVVLVVSLVCCLALLPVIYSGKITRNTTVGDICNVYTSKQQWVDIFSLLSKNEYRSFLWKKSLTYKKEVNRKPTDRRTLKDNILGTGLRTYVQYQFLEGADTISSHAHNEFLETWCELGVIGLFIVICFLVNLYCIKCPVEYKASLTAIIVHSLGYYPCRLASTGLLIIICIGMIEKYRVKKESHAEKISIRLRNHFAGFGNMLKRKKCV